MASIRDVARRAGVAVSTVSKVLNHYPGVSEDTKEKVNKAVSDLNFVPNAVAAALSSKQGGRIAVLMKLPEGTGVSDEIQMRCLSGAIRESAVCGLDAITIFLNMLENRSFEEVVTYLQAQNISGLILFGMDHNDGLLQELVACGEFKCVVIGSDLANEFVSSVRIDQAGAQREVILHAMENMECHKILYIAGREADFATRERIDSVQKLAEEMQIELNLQYGDDSEMRARELTFSYGNETDLIACASDLMAIGAMRALMEMDIFHPVCGFDGLSVMAYAGKQMNTVKVDFERLSSEGIRELKRLLQGENGRNIVIPHEHARVTYLESIS